MSKTRLGIVGCGAIYSTHADAILKVLQAELAGFFDVESSRSHAASERYGRPSFASLDDLLNQCDGICICVPSGLHSPIGIHAAHRGIHVLVEKPIDIGLEPAKALVTACEDAGVKLGSVTQHRFAQPIQRLREAALGGDLGKLVSGDAQVKWYRTQEYYDSGDWRGTWKLDGGGCLMNQGIHTVDMIQWIMGGVRAVQARCLTLAHNIEVEDTANALLEFNNGAVGVLQASTCIYPGMAERLEVHGTYGSVVIEGDRTKVWKVDQAKAQMGKYGDGVMMQPTPNLHVAHNPSCDDDNDPTTTWGEQHRLQIEDFVAAIRDDRPPFVTGRMGLEPLKIILAIYESSRRGGARVEV